MSVGRKSAFITGSTSGIGLAIARSLASAGYDVGLNGFGDQTEIDRLLSEIRGHSGVAAKFFTADLRKPHEIYTAIEEFVDHFGKIDILVNNAGVQHVDPVAEFPTKKWDEIVAVNLSAVFHATKAVLPYMTQANWGRIVNIASVHGLVGSTNKSAYVAAKHGVIGLTKVVALENANHNITCNAVCPGYVKTEIIDRQIQEISKANRKPIGEVMQDMLAEKHPSGRFVEAEGVASLVAYLCSEEAKSMNGAAISIDEGWSVH